MLFASFRSRSRGGGSEAKVKSLKSETYFKTNTPISTVLVTARDLIGGTISTNRKLLNFNLSNMRVNET